MDGLKKACVVLASLEKNEAKEVINYLTKDEKTKIKDGANFLPEEKIDFILTLVENGSF